jgi:drug/metabolite transporter (DMT)-like permease
MRLGAGLVLALLSTAALSYGFYLQHSASGQGPTLTLRRPIQSLSSLFSNWRWLAGFLSGLGGWGLYILALSYAPISLVQATSAGGVGLLALLVRLGGNHLSPQDRLAVSASVAGLVLLGLSLPAGASSAVPHSWQLPLGWALTSVLVAGLAVVLGPGALRPGAGLAIAAGLLYSAGDVATKAAVDGTWPVLLFVGLLLACHGLGFVSLQLSFQRGSALTTAGVATILTNTLPIVAGLTVFSEHLPAGWAGILRGLGFVGTVAGAALLAAAGRVGMTRPAD